MDWKIFLATMSAIFVAELADKTQLVGITMSAKSGRPWSVWLGSVCGYMVVTALSVILGALILKIVRPEIIRYVCASIFVVIGLLMFFGKL